MRPYTLMEHSPESLEPDEVCRGRVHKPGENGYVRKSFDIVTSTLMCHHLNDDALIDFLKRSYLIAKKGVIINDLHRNFLARVAFGTVAPFLFRNRIVFHDGLLSIKRAFTKKDWIAYLKAAEIPAEKYSISWHWAFRWIVFIDTSHNML